MDLPAILRSTFDKVTQLLQGEPLRAIGYGAGVVIFLVTNASGKFADLSLDDSLSAALVASTTLIGVVEGARRFVFSPATVAAIVSDDAVAGADNT